MASPLTIDRVLQHLRVEGDDDDELVFGLLASATRAVENYTGRTFAEGDWAFNSEDADVAALAALLLIGTWYDNRASLAPGATSELPLAVTWLLWPLKRFVV